MIIHYLILLVGVSFILYSTWLYLKTIFTPNKRRVTTLFLEKESREKMQEASNELVQSLQHAWKEMPVLTHYCGIKQPIKSFTKASHYRGHTAISTAFSLLCCQINHTPNKGVKRLFRLQR